MAAVAAVAGEGAADVGCGGSARGAAAAAVAAGKALFTRGGASGAVPGAAADCGGGGEGTVAVAVAAVAELTAA